MPNKFEELKKAKHPLDVLPDLHRYAREGWEAITDDDKERLKWYGVFFRKRTPGHFMMRIRIPNGIATSAQVRELVHITRDYGREVIDLTTRQQVQLRWMCIEDIPAILDRLAAVGLTSMQTGMDNVRNVVGCPLAGLTLYELFDASPVVRAYTERILGDRVLSDLPRKFNVTITGCLENCTHAETQDIALTPATKLIAGTAQPGFNVRIGGKMGSGGMTVATPLNVFVTFEEAAELCTQITLLFAEHGPREARARARLAFLVEEWGIERIRAELERRMGQPLLSAGQDMRGRHQADHIGIVPQKDAGLYAVGLCVPVGRTSAAQLEELARLADQYGSGEVRFTVGQNVLLVNVPDHLLPALLDEPLLRELRPDPTPAMRGTVSCVGIDYCNLALAETKARALEVVRHLERAVLFAMAATGRHSARRSIRPLTMHWSGCPAGCGNHQAADIGLLGGRTRINGTVVETFDIFVEGRTGPNPRPGEKVLENIPADELPGIVEQLVHAHVRGQSLREAAADMAARRAGNAVPFTPATPAQVAGAG